MQKQKKVMSKALKVMATGAIVLSSLGTIPFNTLAADVKATQVANEQITIQNGVKAEYTQIIKTNPWQGNLFATEYVEKKFSEDFSTNEPFPGLGNTNYSVQKTAFVVIPVSGAYIFWSKGDDRTSVRINGVKQLSTDNFNAVSEKNLGHFKGGDVVEISQTVDNDAGIGSMFLKWGKPNLVVENPDGIRTDIPLANTFPTREMAEQAAAKMKGHGVLTEYFDGTSSNIFKGQEIEPESFTKHYGTSEPYPGLGRDYYTVKKTGYIYISETGNYRFNGGGDDYYTLVIDGKELIKSLKYPNFAETGNLYLEKGTTIKIEQTVVNEGTIGFSSLRWMTPSQPAYSDIKVTDVYESKEKALDSNNGMEFDNAREAVNNLFTNKDPNGNITGTMTQADIDAAQALINKVTDPTKKAALQADLNKAQKQLNDNATQTEAENKAREAVNNLFTNKNPNGNITSTVTQADIDAAQALINKVTDPTKKAALQTDLNKAQDQLNDRTTQAEAENKAREAVNNLFTNKNPNGNITGTMTQADIDAAQALINKVTDPTKKAALQADLNKAQKQLNDNTTQAEAENKAREAVNNLFTNKNPNGNITGTMTQADIDAAQALINKVTDPTKKAALQADLNKAQKQLNDNATQTEAENKAREAVNNLFTNKNPNGNITSTVTQAAIDAAQALVNQVTDPTKKAGLQKDLDKAKAQFASKGTLKPDDFVLGTTSITGSYSGDVDRITLSKDGVESGNATKTNGTFRFYVGPGIQKDQSLYMVAYDKNGREIAREKVNIASVSTGQITPTAMTIPGDANITGTYTGDVSRIEVTITDEDGVSKLYKGGTVANGTFRFYSFDKTKSPKDIIVVRA
ncbi:toxin Cry1Ac domain D-VI-related protein, partial [Listeria grandensis]|uniref:toxin Cry1Ac domain D-VI-related protein n=1 Tax=Listeria grandensis TaxID=1494963 RepID=UPI001FD5A773